MDLETFYQITGLLSDAQAIMASDPDKANQWIDEAKSILNDHYDEIVK